MIPVKCLFWAFCFVSCSGVYASNGIFIGNGGDGMEIGGRLIMKDLFLANAHRNPYFGDKIDPQLPDLPGEATMEFDYPRELLARKLTDLNQVLPGFGDYVLASIKVYHWMLQDFPLSKIEDHEEIIVYPSSVHQVQIANRFQASIRIDQKAYQRLDDANRVALIIHEAVYSLVRPLPAGDGRSYQSSYVARDLVGLFFRAEFFKSPERHVLNRVSLSLNIPDFIFPLHELRRTPNWRISAEASGVTGASWTFPALAGNQELVDNSVRFICEKVRALEAEKKLYDLKVELEARPITLHLDSYMAPGSLAIPQMSVRIEPGFFAVGRVVRFPAGSETERCESDLVFQRERLIQDFNWMK